jgi:hypothetical protein
MATPIHSCRRLNDPANSTFTRVIGVGFDLGYGQAAFTDIDTGYSGNPLALVPWQPLNSPTSFMYIGDSLRMRKINASGSLHTIGLPEPAAAPAVALTSPPRYKDVETFDAAAPAGFTAGGTAG